MVSNFLGQNNNDFFKARDDIIKYDQWVQYCRDTRLSTKCLEMLKAGVIYIEGRDEKKQPVIVINPSRIDFSIHKKAEVYMIICRCFIIVKEYMLHDGFIEKWRVIIDGEYQMDFNINYGFILFLIEKFKNYFPNHLDEIYLIRFNKYLNHEQKEILQLLLPAASKIKVLFIFEEEEYKSKIIKSMGQHQLEMKFGGLKMNFKQYWRIVDDGNNMDDEDMMRHFQLLEESLERMIMEYSFKFLSFLKSMNPQTQYILLLINKIDKEAIYLKNKFKTPQELEAEEMQRERVKRSKRQAEKEAYEKEQYELRKKNRKQIFEQQVRFTLPVQQNNDAHIFQRDYNSVGPDYQVNYRQLEDNEYSRKFKNYDFEQYEYVKKSRNADQINYNYFDKSSRYQGMNTDIPAPKQQVYQDKINYQVIQKKYDHENLGAYIPPPSLPKRAVSQEKQMRVERMNSKERQQRQLEQGDIGQDISLIERDYVFDENNKSITQHNSSLSKIDDPNISKISIKSKDKYDMNLHYGRIRGDPNEFVSDIKEETKDADNACNIF